MTLTRASQSDPKVSVVIASRNEGELLRRTVDSFLETLPERSESVVVDDCSNDASAEFLRDGYHGVTLLAPRRSRGASAARNHGVGRTRGEVVVFSDAHVELPEDWLPPLRAALDSETAGVVAPGLSSLSDQSLTGFGHKWDGELRWQWQRKRSEEPYCVPFVGAGFVAMRRDLFRRVGGFDPGILIWGSIGDELCLRLWLLGYECIIVPGVVVPHLFRAKHPYEIDWKAVLHNQMRMAVLHMNEERVSRLFQRHASRAGFVAGMSHLLAGDAWRLRQHYRSIRLRDDDWFFDEFGMDILTG